MTTDMEAGELRKDDSGLAIIPFSLQHVSGEDESAEMARVSAVLQCHV